MTTKNIMTLSTREANLLSQLAATGKSVFTVEDARTILGDSAGVAEALHRLVRKGWLHRLERGLYLVVPLEAGPERSWTESALVIAPHLIQPAALAYWTALHYWNFTEQIPQVTQIQTTGRKQAIEILGMRFQFVTVSEARFFGIIQRSLGDKFFSITDREKTLLDAAARPDLSGGATQLAQALRTANAQVDWAKLGAYLVRWGGGVVVKRLGYLVEVLSIPAPNRELMLKEWQSLVSQGISLLEPGASPDGPVITRWKLRVNVSIAIGGP